MKLIMEYLEHAVHFERLANAERDPTFKAIMMDQAKRYRELAKLRIDRLNLVFVEQQKTQPEGCRSDLTLPARLGHRACATLRGRTD